MSSITTFLGTGLALQSVSVGTGNIVLHVRFTQDPLATNPAGLHDALNPANYTLTGTIAGMVVLSAAIIPADPQAIDLTVSGPLPAGLWTLAVANITTAAADALQAPTSLSFSVIAVASQGPASMGAGNDDSEAVLRKHLNPALKGKAWRSIIAALATGDAYVRSVAAAAYDQLFKISASGAYLERLAAGEGLLKPAGLGMTDDLFRHLSIKTTAAKVTTPAALDVLEVFYGQDSVSAHLTSTRAEPFALTEGQTLQFLVDERDSVTVTFVTGDYVAIRAAFAAEIAAALNRAFEIARVPASAVVDSSTGTKKVRVYSKAKGLESSMRISGGTAQPVFKFSSELTTYPSTSSSGPTIPASPSATQGGDGSVAMTWTASTAALGMLNYDIETSTDGSNFSLVARTTGTTFTDYPPAGDRVYRLRARDTAHNLSGYSAWFAPHIGHTLDAGAAALYRADEGSGSLIDAVGAYTLAANGAPGTGAGKVNTARTFAGGQYFTRAGSGGAAALFLGEWTIESWVKPTTYAPLFRAFNYGPSSHDGTAATNYLMQFALLDDTAIRTYWETGTNVGVDASLVLTAGTFPLNTYMHIVAVKYLITGSTYGVRFYKNGGLIGTITGLANATGGGSSAWCFGVATGPSAGTYISGSVDDTRITAGVRSDFSILVSYLQGV